MAIYAESTGMPMSESALGPYPNLLVKQTRKGWFQECFGCEANTEFLVATKEAPNNNFMYALEETSCMIRFCCGKNRPFDMTLSHGDRAGGAIIATFKRPFACAAAPCKCCCFQQIQAKSATGVDLGKTVETCWYCVPNFEIRKPDGSKEFRVHQPTCCGGMCVNICAGGCCKCRVPFEIYDSEDKPVGEITKIWGGLSKEVLTDADTFETVFPPTADPAAKARVMAAVFLINQIFFETSEGAAAAAGGI
jgi:hypothetical protein